MGRGVGKWEEGGNQSITFKNRGGQKSVNTEKGGGQII